MKKILLIGNDAMGLYKFRRELIQRLLEEHYKVFISTPYGDYIPELEKMGCRYIALDYNRAGTNPLKELRLLAAYSRMIKRNRFDAVLLYTIKPTLYAGLICRMRNIPYLVNITGLSAVLVDTKILKNICFALYRPVLRHANMVFFQNQANMDFLSRKNVVAGNKKLIPGSGVNLKEHKYEPYTEDGKLKILYVGRITRVKGMDEWLKAIDVLHGKWKDLAFEMIGECDSLYQEQVKRMQAQKKLTYHGLCRNSHEYMKHSQAVIMPSYGEGMSNALLEASACGRPILASKVPGCNEILIEGITGLGFEPHSVGEIVKAIEKFRSLSKEQREQMGVKGREHVEKHFSREIIVNEYMKELRKICGGKKNGLV